MESTSHNFSEVTSTSEESTARTKVSRGKSLRACVAKAVGWTLEAANAIPTQENCINKTSRLKRSWRFIEMGLISYVVIFGVTHASLKIITRTRTLKGGGFGLT